MHIKYEWDETKRASTLALRGIDFADMARFDWDTAAIILDDREDYDEPRFRATGLIDGRLHMAVLTPRGSALRIISLRKANERERRRWENR